MPNLAVLIDAENVLPIHADQIFTHASTLGTITVKEIYGAAAALTSWVEPVLKYALHANLTIKASKGKNTSDIALVIGAMDLLVEKNIDTVIIVSSDSDFSALSVRLRSAGIEVVGMGTEKANPLWRTACSSFTVLQAPSFRPAPVQQPARVQPAPQRQEAPANANPAKKKPAAKPVAPTHTERMAIIRAFIREQLDANNGKMAVSALLPALNGLPEYRVDQQRSKRNAHNYLMRLYADAFAFEEGEGGSFISLRQNAPEAEEAPVAADALPEIDVTDQEPAAPQDEPKEEAPAPTEPEAEPDEQAKAVEAFAAKLVDAGIPEDAVQQIIDILNKNQNLRTVYNQMRAVFGGDAGRKYYQIVKEVGHG
ncbi:MAG: NYN domain-containing protein [Clostridia bacterium]|nr:NYN domain-containing protein [Clostridia bacterium]MBR0408462.1 NYN domain-containing protein [Clostridia bacterium]